MLLAVLFVEQESYCSSFRAETSDQKQKDGRTRQKDISLRQLGHLSPKDPVLSVPPSRKDWLFGVKIILLPNYISIRI